MSFWLTRSRPLQMMTSLGGATVCVPLQPTRLEAPQSVPPPDARETPHNTPFNCSDRLVIGDGWSKVSQKMTGISLRCMPHGLLCPTTDSLLGGMTIKAATSATSSHRLLTNVVFIANSLTSKFEGLTPARGRRLCNRDATDICLE